MQHRGPPAGLGDAIPKPPFQNFKGNVAHGVRENASPLPATARGSGTSGIKDRSSSFCHQPTNIMGCRLASVPFYLRMTAMPPLAGRARQGVMSAVHAHAAPGLMDADARR